MSRKALNVKRWVWTLIPIMGALFLSCMDAPNRKDSLRRIRDEERNSLFFNAQSDQFKFKDAKGVFLYSFEPNGAELKKIDHFQKKKIKIPAEGGLIVVGTSTSGMPLLSFPERDQLRISKKDEFPLIFGPSLFIEEHAKKIKVVKALREHYFSLFGSDSDFELYRFNLVKEKGLWRCSEVKQLTYNAKDDVEPAWGPKGQYIVYLKEEGDTSNIALMNDSGDFQTQLTRFKHSSARHPLLMPNGEECLYVSDRGATRDFRIVSITGKGDRRASDDEIERMLYYYQSPDKETRARELKGSAKLSLAQMIPLVEINNPTLSKWRQLVVAAREKRKGKQAEFMPELSIGAIGTLLSGLLFPVALGDAADHSSQGFTRILAKLTIPIFNGDLKRAIKDRDRWSELITSQRYHKAHTAHISKVFGDYIRYCAQHEKQALWQRIEELNRRRLVIYKLLKAEKRVLPDRQILAEKLMKSAKVELKVISNKMNAAKRRLAMVMGMAGRDIIQIQTQSVQSIYPQPPPSKNLYKARMRLVHGDIQRLRFLELRAAAIRDMGPGAQKTSVSVTGGLGVLDYKELADDFLALSLSHAFKLSASTLNKSYIEQWSAEMKAFAKERQALIASIDEKINAHWDHLQMLDIRIKEQEKRMAFFAERLRTTRIRFAAEADSDGASRDVFEPLIAEVEYLSAKVRVIENYEARLLAIAQLYEYAGLGRYLANQLTKVDSKAQHTSNRALWLWRSLEVVKNPQAREAFFRFTTRHGINRIYCFISRINKRLYLDAYNWEFGYFLDECKKRGIKVEALMGNNGWLTPSYREEITALITSLQQFNRRKLQGLAAFSGLKLDVEPHGLPKWHKDSQALKKRYLELLDFIKGTWQKDSTLKLSVDIPDSYFRNGHTPFAKKILEKIDRVTCMVYFNKITTIIKRSDPPLRAAEEAGIKMEVAIESAKVKERGISFYEKSPLTMLRVIKELHARLSLRTSYGGIALHDYTNMKKLMGN